MEALGLLLTEADGDVLAEDEEDTLALGLLLADGLTLLLGDCDNETELLGDCDGESEFEVLEEALEDVETPVADKITHKALTSSPILTKTFMPDLSRSRKNAPFLKPEYKSGTSFPSASRINPLSSKR